MNDDLVDVFEAETLTEAKLLSDRLEAYGVKSFIDHTDSPLDGLVAAEQMKVVRVLPADEKQARQLVTQFESERLSD